MHFSGGLKGKKKNHKSGNWLEFQLGLTSALSQSTERLRLVLCWTHTSHSVKNISISSQLVKEMLLSSYMWMILGTASQETEAESLRWENVTVGGGGESTRCQKSEWKISTILHRRVHCDRPVYLSTVAWEVQEGIAICQQSQRRMERPLWHCQGSSYWVWVSLTVHRNITSHSTGYGSTQDNMENTVESCTVQMDGVITGN